MKICDSLLSMYYWFPSPFHQKIRKGKILVGPEKVIVWFLIATLFPNSHPQDPLLFPRVTVAALSAPGKFRNGFHGPRHGHDGRRLLHGAQGYP